MADIIQIQDNAQIIPSNTVVELNPVEVGGVVSRIGQYIPNLEQDPVQVVLAMDNTDFLSKPIITETANTPVPETSNSHQITTDYTVQSGDTISSIGWQFGLKIATIKYTNNLTSDNIRLGQTLKLPAADVSPALIQQLANKIKQQSIIRINSAPGSKNNAYPYGWCTYYVATRRHVPGSWGNAISWLSSAKRAGYSTGSNPAAGAIVVFNVSFWGHVAYVESVSGGRITISEMNYRGWGMVDRRTISAHGGGIMGYVY